MWKALVRTMIEVNDNPVIAFAIEKTDRIVTADNMKLLSPEDLAEWEAACDEFEGMTADDQQAWLMRCFCHGATFRQSVASVGDYDVIR